MANQEQMDKIAALLKRARIRADLGVRELGRLSGVTPSAISKIESGQITIGPVTMRKLTKALALSPEERNALEDSASAVSERMKTSSSITREWADYDALCQALIRLTGRRARVDYNDFLQGFGTHSGVTVKGYDLVIMLADKTWMGFAFDADKIRLARTSTQHLDTLPKPSAKDFQAQGGLTFFLTSLKPAAD